MTPNELREAWMEAHIALARARAQTREAWAQADMAKRLADNEALAVERAAAGAVKRAEALEKAAREAWLGALAAEVGEAQARLTAATIELESMTATTSEET